MNSKLFLAIVTVITVGVLGFGLLFKTEQPEPVHHVNSQGNKHELLVYKSATCGCCGNWVAYMRAKDYKIEVIDTEEMDSIKKQHGVPQELWSCHTTIVNNGQYYIEGHIPEEAVSKLMEEEPEIKGIGMPGMPAASPGMPGTKAAPFDISKVSPGGAITNFMRI